MNEPNDPRKRDRFGLEAFDEVDPPDQWNEIIRRAETTGLDTTVGDRPRHSASAWIMSAAAVALVAVAAVAISVRSDGDGAPTPATTPDVTLPTPDIEPPTTPEPTNPATTTPATTIPDTTSPPTSVATTTAPTTVVLAAVVDAWEPDCVDRLGDSAGSEGRDPKIAGFTTLGEEPTLDIALPTIETANGTSQPYVTTAVVPGGVLLALAEMAADGTEVATVAVVDLDGAIRWRRCFEGEGRPSAVFVEPGEASSMTLVSNVFTADGASVVARTLDLANGLDLFPATTEPDRFVSDVAAERALLVRWWGASVVERGHELDVFDAATGTVTPIPYPDIAIGDAPDAVRYELVDDDGRFFIAGTSLNSNTPDVVWTGDSWSSDPADLRRLPPVLRLPFIPDSELQLLNGAGDVVWTVPGVNGIGREGFNSAIAASVALVMDCVSWTEEFGCSGTDGSRPDERLVAFDQATGGELWSRPGSHSFALIDGDLGIVTADLDGDGEIDGWELIDLRTGEQVDDVEVTTWADADMFRNACCGEGDYVWTRLDAGVLFESLGESVRVWLPPEFTSPTVSVDLSE